MLAEDSRNGLAVRIAMRTTVEGALQATRWQPEQCRIAERGQGAQAPSPGLVQQYGGESDQDQVGNAEGIHYAAGGAQNGRESQDVQGQGSPQHMVRVLAARGGGQKQPAVGKHLQANCENRSEEGPRREARSGGEYQQ